MSQFCSFHWDARRRVCRLWSERYNDECVQETVARGVGVLWFEKSSFMIILSLCMSLKELLTPQAIVTSPFLGTQQRQRMILQDDNSRPLVNAILLSTKRIQNFELNMPFLVIRFDCHQAQLGWTGIAGIPTKKHMRKNFVGLERHFSKNERGF